MGEGGGPKQTEKYCTRLTLNLSTEQDFFTTVLQKKKLSGCFFIQQMYKGYTAAFRLFYFRVSTI